MSAETHGNLEALLNPRSIALVGTSGDLTKFNGRILKYLVKHGYPGRIFPVNPRYSELVGLPCYPDLAAIPETPDCALIMVATEQVPKVVQQCIDLGIPSAILFSGGFAEQGDEVGRQRQANLKAMVAATNGRLRLLGPNCNGLINYAGRATLASTASLEVPTLPAGSLGYVSQSGGLGLASFPVLAAERRIGMKYNITTGNEVDLQLEDFVAFMAEDPEVRAIACVVEGLRDPARFLAAARRAQALGKPVVALKAGRSDRGAKAASSHTASLAGDYAVFAAAVRGSGVILTEDLDDFLDAIQLAMVPDWPRSPQIGALSLSGGFVTLLSDASDEERIDFAQLSPATEQAVVQLLGRKPSMFNPLDVTASAVVGNVYADSLSLLAADPNVNALVAIVTVSEEYEALCRHIAKVRQEAGKPVAVIWPGGASLGPWCDWLVAQGIPVFNTPHRALRAFRLMAESAEAASLNGEVPLLDPALERRARELLDEGIRSVGHGSLSERQSKDVLAAAGMPVVADRLVQSADAAVAAADAIGYPVVLKVDSPDIPHKTEARAVAIGVDSAVAVRHRYAEICANALRHVPGARILGVSVQAQVTDALEVLCGVHQDSVFGPVISVGLGGVLTEVLGDVAHALPPLTEERVHAMLRSLRGHRLLGAVRGRPPRDVAALVQTVVRLSQLVAALGSSVAELDINPLFVRAEGGGVLIGDALIVLQQTVAQDGKVSR